MTNPFPLRQPCVIVLVGPPGSGKSEWVRRHGAGTVVVSQDGLIDAITPYGFDHGFRSVYAAAEDSIARAGLTARFPVIVDRTNRTSALRVRWIRIAHEAGCQAVAVMMTANSDLCRARNRARQDHRRVSEERMERMLAAMEPVARDEGFVAIFRDDEATLRRILDDHQQAAGKESHEYCNQTR